MFYHLTAEPVYNTRAVVQRTGVPADTFRAWERRYGIPHPERTAGNQRLYSERDIATISWLRDQTRLGLAISQAVDLFRSAEQPARYGASGTSADFETSAIAPVEAFERFRREIVDALSRFDAATAERAVEEAIAITSVERVCLHVLQPVLVEFGDRWERGEIPISAEHFATSFVLRKIGALFNLSRPEVGRGPLIAACIEGELHEVGLLLTCLLLSRRGYQVIYLGANLPVDDLVQTIMQVRPPMVLLSTSTPAGAERLIEAVEDIDLQIVEEGDAGLNPPRPIIGFGGRIYLQSTSLVNRTPGTFLGSNADEAITRIDRLMNVAAPAPSPHR